MVAAPAPEQKSLPAEERERLFLHLRLAELPLGKDRLVVLATVRVGGLLCSPTRQCRTRPLGAPAEGPTHGPRAVEIRLSESGNRPES